MALFVDWSLDFYGSSSLNMILIACSGIARYMEFIPTARVPILQYMSNHFGISCDVSINNYPGQIKSIILYWICTMDERFGDMVLLVSSMYPLMFFPFCCHSTLASPRLMARDYSLQVKEWAKAQNINDPKNGTLNSYSLCLLVIFHFQVLFLT